MTVDPKPVLQADGCRKQYGVVTALSGVSLAVHRGECVALVGESGSGKTTLLRTFNALVTPDKGSVWVQGRNVAECDPVELRRTLGYVPQAGGLLPHWNVLRNAALVPTLQGAPDAEQRAVRALARVGLPADEFARRWPRRLSGGQRQRVALARALAADPEVLLLDEPFGALDALSRAEAQRLLAELLEGGELTALLVTHDLHEAFRLADRVAVLRQGRLMALGTPHELRSADPGSYVRSLLERAGVA